MEMLSLGGVTTPLFHKDLVEGELWTKVSGKVHELREQRLTWEGGGIKENGSRQGREISSRNP